MGNGVVVKSRPPVESLVRSQGYRAFGGKDPEIDRMCTYRRETLAAQLMRRRGAASTGDGKAAAVVVVGHNPAAARLGSRTF